MILTLYFNVSYFIIQNVTLIFSIYCIFFKKKTGKQQKNKNKKKKNKIKETLCVKFVGVYLVTFDVYILNRTN